MDQNMEEGKSLYTHDAAVQVGETRYSFGTNSEELASFFEYYARDIDSAYTSWTGHPLDFWVHIDYSRYQNHSETRIGITAGSLPIIEEAFSKVEEWKEAAKEDFSDARASDDHSTLAPRIFIGHGRSSLWKDLRDHLRDHHGHDVVAYETGARAGHTIRDILEEMSQATDLAFLLHTAEDELEEGQRQARPNVIHETGLFQGRLGFARAIVLLEDGCSEFSNLAGIQQIRFSKGNIREAFGDVLATIRREFRESRNQ